MSVYEYQPLRDNETRVLRLDPAKEYDDELLGSLLHIPLGNPPEFEALSYCWNNSSYTWAENYEWPGEKLHTSLYNAETKKTTFIDLTLEELRNSPVDELRHLYYQMGGERTGGTVFCDGQQISIGSELNEAMRRIRHEVQPRMIWIDALCINQHDNSERNQHVQRMGEIYSKADQVIVWLGEYIGCAYELYEMLIQLSKKISTFRKATTDMAPGELRAMFLQDSEVQKFHWELLANCLKRTWFSRVWILQEVVNSKKTIIQMANCQLHWGYLAGAVSWLRANDVDAPLYSRGEIDSIETILMMIRLSECKKDPVKHPLPGLLDVLQDFRACRSTLPIDKVYGILGLVSQEEASKVIVDYNMSAADLFTLVAIGTLSKENGLEILYLCTKAASESVVDVPSWVPDWTQPCHLHTLAKLGYKCEAAGTSVQSFRVEGRALVAKGWIFDTIQAVELLRKIPLAGNVPDYSQELLNKETLWDQPERQFNDTIQNVKVTSRDWIINAMAIAFPKNSMTKETFESLWRCFCCNRTDNEKVPSSEWSEYFSAFVTRLTQPTEKIEELGERQMHEPFLRANRFVHVFGVWCNYRRFYRSDEGRFGWAPDQARPGDKLCIFNGLAVPLILRPRESGSFEIVGDTYVHGMMDGEILDMDFQEEDICIT